MYDVIREQIRNLKKAGKKVGMITGCFDLVHLGHLRFFNESLKNVDALVIGLESDRSISMSKGGSRPIFDIGYRSQYMDNLQNVWSVFEIYDEYKFSDPQANQIHRRVMDEISPSSVLTCVNMDKYWKDKANRASEYKIEFIPVTVDTSRCLQTTDIIDRIVDKTFFSSN